MENYYLDANALIKSSSILQNYKNEKGIAQIQQLLEQPDVHIYYSSLTLLETWKVIYTEFRKDTFGTNRKNKKKVLSRILTQLTNTLSTAPFEKFDIQIDEIIINHAQGFILKYGERYNVGSMDMLHVALVSKSTSDNIIMVSSDNGVKNICSFEDINHFDPEK
ncbi:MAG: PIN domain-containing protein [Methylomarinum sp.]|nr:PIN domain-containing protein [Methylomarinum sp.]